MTHPSAFSRQTEKDPSVFSIHSAASILVSRSTSHVRNAFVGMGIPTGGPPYLDVSALCDHLHLRFSLAVLSAYNVLLAHVS